MTSHYGNIGITTTKVRRIISLKQLVIAALADIACFYTFPYVWPLLKLPELEWINVAVSGIIAFIIAIIME